MSKKKSGGAGALVPGAKSHLRRVRASTSRAVLPSAAPAKPAKLRKKPFLIVGIGASAGGLDAFTALLEALPPNTGMAFVLVQHLAPDHESILAKLLSKTTPMPVAEVTEGTRVEPDHVYVIPPGTNMAISQGVLRLTARGVTASKHAPIDGFFRSLAEDQNRNAVGVILSGSASDGTIGLKAIKAEGGICFAQQEKTARYSSMPHSAIAAGCVDFVLPPEEIAKELSSIGRQPYVCLPPPTKVNELFFVDNPSFHKIFHLLRNATSVDFTHYKPATIKRRIERRMLLQKIDRLEEYVSVLEVKPSEVEALYNDILIHVTSFFREPSTFQALQSRVFPELIARKVPGDPIRIWVPGCSTGEEAYSIAIALLEHLGDKANSIPIQIFGTDISESALRKARAGVYTPASVHDLSPGRLQRFFVNVEGRYQIHTWVRELCIFARQDLTRDPPFSRLDLVSCRNLLIYLAPILQKRAVSVFHYALNDNSFLALGKSETLSAYTNLFELVDRKNKFYVRRPTSNRPVFDIVATDYEKVTPRKATRFQVAPPFDLEARVDRIVWSRYSHAGLVVNDDLQILHFRGNTSPYLLPVPGEASFHLLKMVRHQLAVEMGEAINQARKRKAPVRKEGIPLEQNGGVRHVNLEVLPVEGPASKGRHFLVLFDTVRSPVGAPEPPAAGGSGEIKESRRIAKLDAELATTKDYLQAIVKEQEATNEDLRSANEEVLSTNEELESTNEELETAKEELQSVNEELTTLNEELQNRNVELVRLSDDLSNLLTGVEIPIIMLGIDRCIRRFAPMTQKALNLIPGDIGRPIHDLKLNIDLPELDQWITDVIDNMRTLEREVQNREGRWYFLRMRPYKTAENKIDGVLMSFVDIDGLKRSLDDAREARNFAEATVETVREPLIVLNPQMRVLRANSAFYRYFKTLPADTENKFVYDLGDGQWNIPRLRELLEQILPRHSVFEGFDMEHDFPEIGYRKMLLNGRQIHRDDQDVNMILLAMEDITERSSASAV